jgi:hypothetical protein
VHNRFIAWWSSVTEHLSSVARRAESYRFRPNLWWLTDGELTTRGYREYLSDLIGTVPPMAREGRSLEATLAEASLNEEFLPPGADTQARQFITGLHRFNVWRVFEEARSTRASGSGGR